MRFSKVEAVSTGTVRPGTLQSRNINTLLQAAINITLHILHREDQKECDTKLNCMLYILKFREDSEVLGEVECTNAKIVLI